MGVKKLFIHTYIRINLYVFFSGAVIVALAFSLSLLSPTILFRSKLWWIIGLGGGLLLYYANTYIAFMGGLIIGLYVFSLWPYVIQSVMGLPPARTMTLAMLVYIVWILAAVWVVAYNFVPVGGTIAREQTGIVMGLVMMGVAGLALFIGRSKARGGKEPLKRTESRGASDRRFFAYGTRPGGVRSECVVCSLLFQCSITFACSCGSYWTGCQI